MNAEEKLKQWYKYCGGKDDIKRYGLPRHEVYGSIIAPEHIDLIADLVIERMKASVKPERGIFKQ